MKKRQDDNIKSRIDALPKGNITYKTIRGAKRMYLQWYENGEKKSRYVKKEDEALILSLVEKRKQLEGMLKTYDFESSGDRHGIVSETFSFHKYETRVVAGPELSRMCEAVKGHGRRDCFYTLDSFLRSDRDGKVCIVYGLRRTGKTFMLRQAISDLPMNETVYIKIRTSDNMAMLNRDLMHLSGEGIKYIFIDEITLMSDFIDSASLLSDIYASSGMKIILSGTDSLGFALSLEDELYDRAVMIHTTFIPFREYSRLLGIDDVDEYIRYGGTFRVGELDFEDDELSDGGASFADDESARRYIDTSIARNIQHSLSNYKAGGHFRHLTDLYEAGELTNAINRLIEDMNHRFLISVITRDSLDEKKVIDKLKSILDIKNKGETSVELSNDHLNEIKQYLLMLDLIVNAPTETLSGDSGIERIIFSQPGLRYCQAQALVYSLLKDKAFLEFPAAKRKEVTELILEEVRGRMLEEIVLLETVKSLPRGKRAFKLEFAAGEIDMVICDENKLTCELYEIKHSSVIDKKQCRHLTDKKKCNNIEFRYGDIIKKAVLYNGGKKTEGDVLYINVSEYLKELGNN